MTNDADLLRLRNLLDSCLTGSTPFRILQTNMVWDQDNPVRPLRFLNEKMNMRTDMDNCENSQAVFNYPEGGFSGVKKRTIIIIDT